MVKRRLAIHDIKLTHCCCIFDNFVGKHQRHQSLLFFANLTKHLGVDSIYSLLLAFIIPAVRTKSRITADFWVNQRLKAGLFPLAILPFAIAQLTEGLFYPASTGVYSHFKLQVVMRYLHMHEPFVVGTLENDLRKILYHFDSLLSTFSIRANNQQYYCDKEYGQTFSLPVIILHINNPSQSYGRVTMKVGQGVSINTLLLSHHCRNHRSTNWLVHHLCCFCLQQFPNRSV